VLTDPVELSIRTDSVGQMFSPGAAHAIVSIDRLSRPNNATLIGGVCLVEGGVTYPMGILDSFGGLVGSIIAAIVMLLFAILSFFVTVFIVQAGAGLANYSPSGDFVVLAAAILAASAIMAGSSPMTSLGDTQ
jgi:hypothetical protein